MHIKNIWFFNLQNPRNDNEAVHWMEKGKYSSYSKERWKTNTKKLWSSIVPTYLWRNLERFLFNKMFKILLKIKLCHRIILLLNWMILPLSTCYLSPIRVNSKPLLVATIKTNPVFRKVWKMFRKEMFTECKQRKCPFSNKISFINCTNVHNV